MATLAQRGSGTPVTSGTTWTTTTNVYDGAVGTTPATYAVWTSSTSGATGYIECTGYAFAAVPADATVTSVSINVRHVVNNATRIASGFAQLYDGATTIGAQQALTVNNTSPFTANFVRNPTLAQLKSATFKVRVSFTRAAVTQSATCSVDYVDITADYTVPVKSGSATTAHAWAPSASGVKPVLPNVGNATETHTWGASASGTEMPKGATTTSWVATATASGISPIPAPPDTRVDESGAVRTTEAGVNRELESAVAVVLKQGTATVTWSEASTSVGKRTPKATATTTYVEAPAAAGTKTPKGITTAAWAEAPTAAGKKTPKGAPTTTWTETISAVGTKTPKATVTTAFTETVTAAGVKPLVGVKQGTAVVGWANAVTGAGKRMPKSAGTTTYTETTAAAGRKVQSGAATTSWTTSSTAAGKRVPKGAITTTSLQTPTASGKRTPKGAPTANDTWSIIAQGVKPLVGVKQGTALVFTAWAPASTGKRAPKGATAPVVHTWALTAAGTAPVVIPKQGSAVAAASWTPAAVGKRVPKGRGIAYLLPVTGSATTPDPGPLPVRYTLAFKVRGPMGNGSTFQAIAAQSENHATDRAFVLQRRGSDSAVQVISYPLGTLTGSVGRNVIPQQKTLDVEYLAYAMNQNNGVGNTATGWVNDGTWRLTYGPLTPTEILTSFDSSQPIRIGKITSAGTPFDERIYSVELRSGLDPSGVAPAGATINLPNANGSYLSLPVDSALNITGDIEIVVRAQLGVADSVTLHVAFSKAGAATSRQRAWSLGYFNSRWRFMFGTDADGGFNSFQPNVGVATGQVRWIRARRTAADGVVSLEWAADQETEPTVWTHYTGSPSAPGVFLAGALVNCATPVAISGRAGGTAEAGVGRVQRAILRSGIGGPTVLDVDETLIPTDPVTTFLARTGQTVTVNGDPLDSVPSQLLWRFDANDYPGTGTTYADPRGRTWTLQAATAISSDISVTWNVTAVGAKPQRGTAATSFSYAPAVTDKRVTKGLAVLTYTEVLSVAARRIPKAQGAVAVLFVIDSFGMRGIVRGVEGIWNGQKVVAMQYGDKAVLDWILTPA